MPVRMSQNVWEACASAVVLVFAASGGAARDATATPGIFGEPATQPATAPATRPIPAAPSKELDRKWRWYLVTWGGRDIASQSAADQQLVDALMKGDAYDAMALRKVMMAEYERQSAAQRRDEFTLGRLAARIATAWTRAPADKQLTPIQIALYKKETCQEVCRWGVVSLGHFAGDIPKPIWEKYRGFLPGTALSMLSLVAGCGPYLDRPGDLRDELVKLRTPLEKLASADENQRDQLDLQFSRFFQLIEPYGKLQADKQAVLKLADGFRDAYNRRDDKAFAALWPEGHPATRFLANRPLADKIEPTHWTITTWQPVYVLVVKDNTAQVLVISQYAAKDGTARPQQLQPFPAKRHEKEGWKLN